MFLKTLDTVRALSRLQEIAAVLIRHGLGDLVSRLGIARRLEQAGKLLRLDPAPPVDRTLEERLRLALEELGPAFVKLGQILAGRADLLGPTWTKELSQLYESATPVPFEELREQLEEDLGGPPAEKFAFFDEEPLASASIAQVHRARLHDGTEVAVKVRRPHIQELVDSDLHLLTTLAEMAEDEIPELRRYRPIAIIRQFSRSLRDELDLRVEARNAARLRENLERAAQEGRSEAEKNAALALVIPRIFSAWTHERVCVMEFLEGVSLAEWLDARSADEDIEARKRLAAIGADAVLSSVFVDGRFHADPHAGNLFVLGDGRVGLIDFGMVGFLSESRRLELLELLVSVSTGDVDRAVDVLLEWTDRDTDPGILRQEVAAFVDRHHGRSLGEVDTRQLLSDLGALLRDNGLVLPGDVAVLFKVFVTLDGLGRQLDPDFVMARHIEPFALAAWKREHGPLGTVRRGARGISSFLQSLPSDFRHLSRLTRRGRIRVDVDVERLETFGRRLDHSANRVTVGLVTSALIVGTAIAMTVTGGPTIFGLPALGLLGFLTSLGAGVVLLWSIFRSHKA